ncbi:MAG TPA: helix-turn-helix domain-containing protein [Accumulibacter sp.]|uniref:helix-turn-helix domain-containing protein n=1 Tax=Accumulibacter sp. TaxID=2053492 RepID=UPI002C34CD60|nr:helix-turn-helix domain-containing protein [Accumulibacter sp.]HRF72141.1 helix-turn-helix domain-containing protein [Accumulibacter sp.]
MSETPANTASQDPAKTPEVAYDLAPVADVATGALAARLKVLIGTQSVASFSRQCGIAESVLRTYLRDGRMPPLDKAFAIAAAAGVTVDWLATGHGAGVAAEARAAYAAKQLATGNRELPVIDAAVLEGILKAVLTAQGAQASPAQLAALVVDLYQRALNAGDH